MGQKLAAYDAQGNIVAFYDTVDSPAPNSVNSIKITDCEWRSLLLSQSKGKVLVVDESGNIATKDAPPPAKEEVAAKKKRERDLLLSKTDWLIVRHNEEKMSQSNSTLSDLEFSALSKYRQSLRDMTAQSGFPYVEFPDEPDFLRSK